MPHGSRKNGRVVFFIHFSVSKIPVLISMSWCVQARVFYIVSYLLSTVSVACNSPKTFEDVPGLRYATLAVDVVLAFPFGLLIVSELRYRGLWKVSLLEWSCYVFDINFV